ncbi:hypothetical protein CHS0354_017416 [Potamilus streckersoni]|uniref:Uncharacterized protein n=1 Tax=Potamilus streckersoni TaxID=2493646 RepID=A0AAE0WA61_9BIVA|nr:hypothetical protein CHS0354_017416 [Potamilus streckersoni]
MHQRLETAKVKRGIWIRPNTQILLQKNLKKGRRVKGLIKLHKADTEKWSQTIFKSSQYTPKATNKHYIPTLFFLYCRFNGKRQWKSSNNAYTNTKDVRNKRSTSQEVDNDSTDSKTCSSNKSNSVLGIDQGPKGIQN